MLIGDLVSYKGKLGKVTGCGKNNKIIVELKNSPYIPGITEDTTETITVEENELRIIESADEHFFILTEQGKEPKQYLTSEELINNIQPEQINKATVYLFWLYIIY